MNVKEIKDLLKILGITSKDQLNEKDINYWWSKRYIYLKHENYPLDEKNKDLMILNNAKDELLKYKIEIIKGIFDNNNSQELDSEIDDTRLNVEDDINREYKQHNQNEREFSRNRESKQSNNNEREYERNSNYSNRLIKTDSKENDDLKAKLKWVGGLLTLVIVYIVADEFYRQHQLFKLQCAFSPRNWLAEEEVIDNCVRRKWSELFGF